MAETTSSRIEQREAEGRITLTPELQGRVDSPRGSITILNCKDAEGQDSGLNMYGISLSDLLKSLTPTDASPDGKGIISGLRSGKFSKLFRNLSLAGSLALGTAACDTDDNQDRSSYSATYGVKESALTDYDQVLDVDSFSAQPVPWSKPGNLTSNFSEIDGERYLMAATVNEVRYVKVDQLANLYDGVVGGTPKVLQGLNNGSEPVPPYDSPAMWKDNNGNRKFSIGGNDNFVNFNTYKGDIKENSSGNLENSNMAPVNPGFAGGSYFMKNGVPSLLGYQGLMNLNTGVVENISQNNDDLDCGPSTFDGNVAVGSKKQKLLDGTTQCKLIAAKTIEELATNPTFLTTLNNIGGMLRHPRMISDGPNGSVLVFAVGEPGKEILWIVKIPPKKIVTPDSDTTIDSDTVDSTNDGSTDDVVTPDQDATVDQDTTIPTDDVADAIDAVIEIDAADIEEVTPDVEAQDVPPELPPVDATDTIDTPDTEITPDGQQDTLDTSKPDTTPDTTEVTPTLTGFEVTVGDCKLEPTPITQGGKDGFNVDIHGSGANNALCKFTGVSNGKPVEITLTNDANGDIQITCITFAGSELNCEVGLDTTAELLEDGAQAKIKANGITLGSAASNFFTTRRANGFVDIKNVLGEPVVTVDGPNFTFTVPGDNIVYRIDSKTGGMEEKFPTFPGKDAGNSIDVQPQKVDGGSDASVSTPPPGKGGGGCIAAPGSVDSSAAMLAAAAGAAILFFRRKRETEKRAA